MIQEIVGACGGISRRELAHTVCELLELKRPSNRLKARECSDLPELLESRVVLILPDKKRKGQNSSQKIVLESPCKQPKSENPTWKAGRAFHPKSGPELEEGVQYWLLKILEGKAGLMAGRMRRSATLKKFTDKQREPVEICATYLKNKAPYLKYDRYLEPGFTIATGVIEGVCRHLVKDRMDITGAKWRLTSAEAVLRLRALRNSNDFDEYWDFHEDCEYKQNHQTLYRDGEVPATKLPQPSSGRGRLRVIK